MRGGGLFVVLAACSSFGTAPSSEDGGVSQPRSDGGGDSSSTESPKTYAALISEDQPLAYWRFGETSGASARSEVGSPAMDATIGGAPERGRPGAISGDPNTAFEFDGQSGDYVTAGDKFDFKGRESFSLEAWVFLTKVDGNYRHIFVKDFENNTAIREEYGVYVQDGNGLAFERHVAGKKYQVQTPIRTMTWHHVVALYDGDRIALYVDGKEANSKADDRLQLTKTEPFYMGRKGPNDGPLFGAMDEVAVYGKALTAERIMAHYLGGSAQKARR